MNHKVAKVVSLVFHPLVFAVLTPFLVVYHSTGDILYGLKWMVFSLFFLLLGLIVFFFIEPVTLLTDFDISNRQKRPIFYTISLLFAIIFFLSAIFFKGIFFPLSIVSLGIVIGLIVFEFVNFFLKVSIHIAVSSAYVITVGILYGPIAFFSVFWIPFVLFWSRIVLRKHTRAEAVAGIVLGPIVTLLTFAIGRILV